MKFLLLFLIIFVGCTTPTYEITCEVDRDCGSGQSCNTETNSCENDDTECKGNQDCPPGKICDTENKCSIPKVCTDAESCYRLFPEEWDRETKPAKCFHEACVLDACTGNNDCIAGKVCQGGTCTTPVSCDLIDSVKIITPSVVLKEGETETLKANVFNKNGVAIVVENGKLTWESDNSNIVSVDNNGLITGKLTSGVANITVKHLDCGKTSPSLSIKNFADLAENKLRIILRDLYTGQPVSAGSIIINQTAPVVTDSLGWIEIDNTSVKNTILVKHENYQYLSILDTEAKDIILYLTPFVPQNKAGGYKGEFNFDSIANDNTLKIGIAGASLPSTLLDISFDFLLSESYVKHINAAGFDGDYPIPSNIVMVLGDDVIQDKYAVSTPKGNIAFWGLGSKMRMSEFLSIVQSIMGEDELDMGALIRELTPYLKTFYHALKTDNNTVNCDKKVDVNDINGNGKTDDLIPDYDNDTCFPSVSLKLEKPLNLVSKIKNPKLIKMDNKLADTAIAIIGYNIDGAGFIPVGVTVGSDQIDDADLADGIVEDISLNYSPQYNGMEGGSNSLVLLAMKLGNDKNTTKADEEPPAKVRLSGLLINNKTTVPKVFDLSNKNFLKTTDDATYTDPTVNFTQVADANIYRIKIKSKTGKLLIIYTTKSNFKIPDITDFGEIEFILIQAVQSSKSIDDILEFNDSNLNKFSDFVTAFSVFEL